MDATVRITPEQISEIITRVTTAIVGVRGGARADIHPITPGGMKLYLKVIKASDKDEYWIKISQ